MSDNNVTAKATTTSELSNDDQTIRLPWGAIKEKNFYFLNVNCDKKPGEYIMHLVFHNFVIISSKKIDQILNGDRRVCFKIKKKFSKKKK
jgi:hypothetical protein